MNTVPRPTAEFDVLCIGRSCIDLYAHEIGVPITAVKSFDAYVGGCPTNVSVGTRRLGLRSALLTAVGEDQVGEFVLHFLNAEGVNTRFIPHKRGRRTSAVILTIQPPDRFPLTFYRDNCADLGLTTEDVAKCPIADTRFVFLTGTGLMMDPSRTATMFAAERAHDHGVPVLVDLDYRPDQWASAAVYGTNVRALLRLATLAIGTEEETRAAAGIEELEELDQAVERLLDSGIDALIVKRGARGSSVYRNDGSVNDVSAFPVEVLNVLGAGDAFASGFLYGQVQGWSLEASARMGNAVGAIVVTRHGCANFMPHLHEVQRFMSEHGTEIDTLVQL
jgi:5-dehydro-2-deoxygluconokinase